MVSVGTAQRKRTGPGVSSRLCSVSNRRVGLTNSLPVNDHDVLCGVEQIAADDLPAGDVVIDVGCSSLNYKDALACQGRPGVVRNFPHVPGIDCAGQVVQSESPEFQSGDAVLVTGQGLGSEQWGGYAVRVRVPAEWVVPLPAGLTIDDAMVYGTAGFTAAQCVTSIQHHGVEPDAGEVVVTGASGGVGTVSIAILSKLGYRVAAVTGKPEQARLLQQLGATRIISRVCPGAAGETHHGRGKNNGHSDHDRLPCNHDGVPRSTQCRSHQY